MKYLKDLFANSAAARAAGIGAALLLMAGAAQAATVIGTSITTGGSVTTVGVTSTGNVTVGGFATTTASSGNFATNGSVTTVGVTSTGDVTVGGLATTSAASGNFATKGTVTIGGSSAITSMLFGTCTVTPGAIAAGTSTTATCTAAGVGASDKVFVEAPASGASSDNWLVPFGATPSTNTITIQIFNASSTAAATGLARTWSWMAVH